MVFLPIFSTPGVQDLSMAWNGPGTELGTRADNIQTVNEGFKYDQAFRLTNSISYNSSSANPGLSFAYDNDPSGGTRGNIEKSDAGILQSNSFNYYLHRLTSVKVPTTISPNPQNIGYTAFNQPSAIAENNYRLNIAYNADYERESSSFTDMGSNTVLEKREYHGDWERISDPSLGTDHIISYISGGDGVCAMSVLDLSYHNIGAVSSITYNIINGPMGPSGSATQTSTITVSDGVNSVTVTPQIYYVYKDHLGSFLTLAQLDNNNIPVIAGQQNFDAWGKIRNPADWSYSFSTATNFTAMPSWMMRGFTGQEHLPWFGLINLNARLYDPLAGRMLGPDKYIKDPLNTQDYNAYTYARNNPMSYNDPSGNFAMLIAAAIFGTVNLCTDLVTHHGNMNIGEMGLSFGEGAVAGMLGAGGFECAGDAIASACVSQVNKFVPSIPIVQTSNLSLSISPIIGFGTAGFNLGGSLNGTYTSGDVKISGSIGGGYNSGMNDIKDVGGASSYWNWSGGPGVYNKNHSTFYSLTWSSNIFSGKTAQGVGAIRGQFGDFSARMDEDFMWDGKDRFRTGGFIATYKINSDVTLAFGGSMMSGQSDGTQMKSDGLMNFNNPNLPYGGIYDPEHETLTDLRGGTMYGGVIYKGEAVFIGNNSEDRMHDVQNWIHRNITRTSPYFYNHYEGEQRYNYFGSYNANYLYY